MKRILLLTTAALLLSVTTSQAEGVRTQCSYSKWHGVTCTVRTIPDEMPMTPEEVAERDARIAEWESFCKPVGVPDKYGVTRLQYAHAGCEFGRRK